MQERKTFLYLPSKNGNVLKKILTFSAHSQISNNTKIIWYCDKRIVSNVDTAKLDLL